MTVPRTLYRALLKLHRRLCFNLIDAELSCGSSQRCLRMAFTTPCEKTPPEHRLRQGFQALRLVSCAPDPLLAQVLGLWSLALRGLDHGVPQGVVLEDAAIVLAVWHQLAGQEPWVQSPTIQQQLDDLAQEVCQWHLKSAEGGDEEPPMLAALNAVLFGTQRFRPATHAEYYAPDSSLIDRVLELRTGNPLLMCIVYMAVARRCGVSLQPVALPQHFMVFAPSAGLYVDVFHRGLCLTASECLAHAKRISRTAVTPADLQPAATSAVVLRLLRNVQNVYRLRHDDLRNTHLAAQAQMMRDWSWPDEPADPAAPSPAS